MSVDAQVDRIRRSRITSVAGIVAGALLVMLLLTACASGEGSDVPRSQEPSATAAGDELTIAIAGMVTPKDGLEYYLGLAEYVGRKAGRPVRLVHKASYEEVNGMLEDGKIDVAFVCSGPYAKGHDAYGLTLVAAPVVNGKPEYYSYVIAPASSPATSLASLKGATFAYADPESNTGCLVPRFMVTDMGENPGEFFGKTFFTYGHDNSIKAVATGEADGAAVDSLIWDYADATGSAFTKKTKIVQRSQAFAIPPVVARPGLDDATFAAVQKAFLGAHEDPEGKALLDKMKIERFTTIDDSAYDSIREMSKRVEAGE